MSTLQQKVETMEKVGAGDLSPAQPSYCSCLWTYRIAKLYVPICTLSHDTGASWLTACPAILIDI